MFGLSPSDLEEIIEVLKRFPQVQEAAIFGSRALGRYKGGSDIDIVLKGPRAHEAVGDISALLNESTPLPYFFDIVDYDSLKSEDLKEHIDRAALRFYPD